MLRTALYCGLAVLASALNANAEVIIKDGDDLIIDGQDYGFVTVDAFEPGQTCKDERGSDYDCGERARATLSSMIVGEPAECSTVGTAGERLLATCIVGDVDLESAMVAEGWAFPRRDFQPHLPERFAKLCATEAEARDAKRGAWAGTFDIPYVQKRGRQDLSEIACPEFPIAGASAETTAEATGLANSEWSWWDREIVAAIIGAVSGILAAAIAAGLLIWQVGRQLRNAIESTRENERLELKLDVYREVVSLCSSSSTAEIDLLNYVRLFDHAVKQARAQEQNGKAVWIPDSNVPRLLELKKAFDEGIVELALATERWEVIDPRTYIFRKAFHIGSGRVLSAFSSYFEVALKTMPEEPSMQLGAVEWRPPDDQMSESLEAAGSNLIEALMDVSGYTSDFQLAMQNLLLGDLFENQLPARTPLDPEVTVITLDNHEELARYFDNETAEGRKLKGAEDKVRAEVATHPDAPVGQ